ncbi:MAG: DUF4332 domain-containing protein [Candidatus Thermoplasmatota archaeon]
MDLKHIKGIGPSKQEKLKAAGIDSVDALARADIDAVAAKTGLPASAVKEYKQKAAALALLEDLKGVGPATVTVLAEAGIQSLKDLTEASVDFLAKELKLAQTKIRELQAQAAKDAKRIAEEAKTPEGRAKLVKESKALAQEGAHKAQKAAKDAIAQAQKVSKDFQEKAPQYVEKAQVVLKDAETRAKSAAHKAQVAVQHEVQKVKASSEQAVANTKARFSKPKQ